MDQKKKQGIPRPEFGRRNSKRYFSRTVCAALRIALIFSLVQTSASGTVFDVFPSQQESVSELGTWLEKPNSRAREFILNGKRISGVISKSDFAPKELVQNLQQEWQARHALIEQRDENSKPQNKNRSRNGSRNGSKNDEKNNKRSNRELDQLGIHKPFVSHGENWAMFANLNLLSKFKRKDSPVLADKYIVLATQENDVATATVWKFKVPDRVRPLSLLSPTKYQGDLPVSNDSVLVWSLLQSSESLESSLFVFSNRGNSAQLADHYKAQMSRKGFRHKEFVSPQSRMTQLTFSKRGTEIDWVIKPKQAGSNDLEEFISIRKF